MMAPSEPHPGITIPSSRAVGARIKKARDEHPHGPMKRAQLAVDLGIHDDTLTAYESGTREVGAVTLWRISQLTKRPFSYFADQAPETAHARLARVAAATQDEIAHLTVRLDALMRELRDARSDAAATSGEADIDDAARRGAEGAN
jgi:transcriptional regulator with XRE-family HTH domain